jgi:nitroimidazol reductase NimA-like FMN-containing flavoprotein (pyridoxamine 5'-phosphate oxidase superfamily)
LWVFFNSLLDLPEWARTVLSTAPVAYVGMTDQDGPYVVPVSFTYTGEEILFHGGPGKKSLALAGC